MFRAASLLVVVSLFVVGPSVAEEANFADLEKAFVPQVTPLVTKYCRECHSPDLAEADLDLTRFATFAVVRKAPQVWQKIGEMLEGGQMPPIDSPQPSDDERKQLRSWVQAYLTLEARAQAGDPGRVVLRRLSNAEYKYTVRDLTGVATLDPTREFPVDGAAGEGFTNTGNALVMSPALVTKYLDAGKEIANHAVLLPDGLRFSPSTTRRDWTEELLAQIRQYYAQYTDQTGGDRVNLQGVVFDTNGGGRLPLERYLRATLEEREALLAGRTALAEVANKRSLNAKYLSLLWQTLNNSKNSLLLQRLSEHWQKAKPDDAPALAGEIAGWQKELWRFTTVGHIGKVGGPKRWMEPVEPLVARQEVRFKFPATIEGNEVVLSLVTTTAGDGNENDFVVWQQPRLVAPGRSDLLLKDVSALAAALSADRERIFSATAKYLAAADEASRSEGKADVTALAQKHGVEQEPLAAWLEYLGVAAAGATELKGHFTNKLTKSGDYDFIAGWGSNDTPLLLANSSDQHVRIPGNMKPHSVAVHPSPTLKAAVGWQSPVAGTLKIEGVVGHAHPECGNGVTWSLELRRGSTRQRLASGVAQGAAEVKVGQIDKLPVQKGDLVSLLIGPREGNHSCDLTFVDLTLSELGEDGKKWRLADLSKDILAGNPHDDHLGNRGVWHFYTEAEKDAAGPVIPADSLLARWQLAASPDRAKLADQLQTLLTGGKSPEANSSDGQLYRQLTSLQGPLLRTSLKRATESTKPVKSEWGLDGALFGNHPDGSMIEAASLCVQAPKVLTVRLPAELVAGCEFVATAGLDPKAGREGSAQVRVALGKVGEADLLPVGAETRDAGGRWTDPHQQTSFSAPILVSDDSAARRRWVAALDDFRQLFPAALCYTKIVPVDEVVTLTLYYREDDHLGRLMLSDQEQRRLDRLWDELHYVSQDAFTLVDALQQLIEFATQDADPKVFTPLREPFQQRADRFHEQLLASEPKHLQAAIEFAANAYRRPLREKERAELMNLYTQLRREELPHDTAIRLVLARVLVAPAFLYRSETPVAGTKQGPVNDWELATRLSYLLWSSLPDVELRQQAERGTLHEPEVLVGQMRRMLRDPKARRLATEFACQWLHIYDFDQLDEKSERHFPQFTELRDDMYEESILFFTDLLQNDGSLLDIFSSDHTFLNEALAKHYGVPNVSGDQWRKVEGLKQLGRGGILGQATTLAKQSGASRTSPILRGNWISEVLLGERLPRPPKGVPQLPDDESATAGLTVRQLTEKHSSDPKCAVCHRRIDPLGFALEEFDAIGARRQKDLANRPIDTHAKTLDGAEFEGLAGLREYLLTARRDALVRQFCKKLLGYALGRSVQLSDEPLLAEMRADLEKHDFKLSAAFERIVLSPQFREIRGRERAGEE
jgi:hypothetical protein